MEADTSRWFIDSHGPDTSALKTAFSWLLKKIGASSENRRGLLVVHGKGNLESTVGAVFGPAVAKKLGKENQVRIRGSAIELMTERIKPYGWSGPVLAVHPSPRLLDMVDSLSTPSEILVVPWLRDEVEPWIQMWGARELGSSAEPDTKRFSNPTVRAALASLTRRVNLSTGIAHPSDRAATVEMFRLLYAAGEDFDPPEVRSWLISELNWQPKDANDVRDVAEGVLSGKRFRASGYGAWVPDIVERWRESGPHDSESKE